MRIGVDSGGTFTDVVADLGDGTLRHLKLPSRRGDGEGPEAAVIEGLRAVGGLDGQRADSTAVEVIHGTTVGTNALLERSGGPTALVTTAGFEDVLLLRRHARPKLYALHPELPEPLVPASLCFGLGERLGAGGEVVLPLDEAELEALAVELAARIGRGEVRSIAVSLLHAWTNPAHERRVGERLAQLGVPLSLSSEVLPEHREYERTSTTVVDAFLAPPVGAYLARLGAVLPRLRVMRSDGGAVRAEEVARRPARSVLSGPAAGVVGVWTVARSLGEERVLTLDMGGTSTDVALIDGTEDGAAGDEPRAEVDAEGRFAVEGVCVRLPSLPVVSVGAGGGSIAWRDAGGALKVGPRSAGARPGPACWGAGGAEPTVTDAALLLGRIPLADHAAGHPGFLGGGLTLDEKGAAQAISELAGSLGLSSLETATGVIRVAAAKMARAITQVSAPRGHDPRDFTLVAFGGAGGLLACDVAEALELPRVLIPPAPGLLCAYGALVADVIRDHASSRITLCGPALTAADLAAELSLLTATVEEQLDAEAVPAPRRRLERRLDLRYRGQSYELSVPLPDPSLEPTFDVLAAFHALHEARYGFSDPARPVERVVLRVIGRGSAPPAPPLSVDFEAGPAQVGASRTPSGEAPVLWRARLVPGTRIEGPAVIAEYSATTWISTGWRGNVGARGALSLERR